MTTAADGTTDTLIVAYQVLAERGWRGLTFRAIAERAELPLVEIYRRHRGRGSLLRDLHRRMDEAMLDVDPAELHGLPARDRVFELLMRRFEAMVPFRAGLARLARDVRRQPDILIATACRLDRSFTWLQDAGGLPCHGLRARVARRALGFAYLQTLRVWLGDDAADLGPTMAELDKQLRRVETVAGFGDAPGEGVTEKPQDLAAQPT